MFWGDNSTPRPRTGNRGRKRPTGGSRTTRLMLWTSRVYSSTTSTLPANTNVRARFQLITRRGSNEALSNRTGSMCRAIPPRSCLWWVDNLVSGAVGDVGHISISVHHHTPRRREMLLLPVHDSPYRSLLSLLVDREPFLPQTTNLFHTCNV